MRQRAGRERSHNVYVITAAVTVGNGGVGGDSIPLRTLGDSVGEASKFPGTSLVTQWLRLCIPNAGGPGSIPGQGTSSHMHAATKEPASCN